MTKKESVQKVHDKLDKAYESSSINPEDLVVDDKDIKDIYNVVIKVIRGYCRTYDLEKLNKQQSILDKFEQDLLHDIEMATKKTDMINLSYQLQEVRKIRRTCKHNIVKVLFYSEVMNVLGALNSKNINKTVKNFQTAVKSEKFPHYNYHIDDEGMTGKNEIRKFEVSSDIVDESKPNNERVTHWKQIYECKNKEEARELAINDLREQNIRVWSKLKVKVV